MNINDRETILRRLRALKALAEDPNAAEGERAMATESFHRLRQRHEVTFEELNAHAVRLHTVSFSSPQEYQLAVQIVGKITDQVEVTPRETGRSKATFALTRQQAEHFDVEYTRYRRLLRQEMQRLLHAFVNKHALYPPRMGAVAVGVEEAAKIQALMEVLS